MAETCELPGASLSFRRLGSGPCVVLLHGLGATGRAWDGLTAELATDHLVVVPDLPGHGSSRIRNGDHSLGAVATALRDLLVMIGQPRATVVGHSLGGGVALHFAYQYPERCERLVLVAPGGFGVEVHPRLRAMALPGAGVSLALWAGISRLARQRRRSARPAVDLGADRVEAGGAGCSLGLLRGVVGHRGQRIRAGDGLAAVSRALPTLVVWGTADRMLPVAHAAAAQAAAPDIRLEVMEDLGHCPHLEDPAAFASLVRGFLATPAGRVDDRRWQHLIRAARTAPGP
jgi:pimeloyl-ACP methyl ester carboxylesterase